MIDAHPEVAIFPETHMLGVLDFVGALESFRDSWQYILFMNEVWANLVDYSDPAATVWAEHAIRQPKYVGPTADLLHEIGRAYAIAREARFWGEKTPGHALWLTAIRTLFPSANIIFTVRDPRDVLVSYCERWNAGRCDPQFVMESAANVRYHLDRLLQAPAFPREQIHWVRYEALTADPELEMRHICRFLKVDFVPEVLTFYQRHANVEHETPDGVHHKLLSKPVSRERVGVFRRTFSPSLLSLIETFLTEEMTALGYSPEAPLHVTRTSEEHEANLKALRHYHDIAIGRIRTQQRTRMRRKIWLYRHFNRVLACVPSSRIAVSSEDWRQRAATLSLRSSAARASSG
jgi:hypothetical protein